MNEIAYRIAGAFCCVIAVFMLGCAIYVPFFTVMAPTGKLIMGVGGLGTAGFFGYIGTQYLINGGPT